MEISISRTERGAIEAGETGVPEIALDMRSHIPLKRVVECGIRRLVPDEGLEAKAV